MLGGDAIILCYSAILVLISVTMETTYLISSEKVPKMYMISFYIFDLFQSLWTSSEFQVTNQRYGH